MALHVSERVLIKLRDKHGLTKQDIYECFSNREGAFLEDMRDKHKTDPKTQWFIAQNNMGKKIKVVFMLLKDGTVLIKSAFMPNEIELKIYSEYRLKDVR